MSFVRTVVDQKTGVASQVYDDVLERRLFRLHLQVVRRGFFMPMWNLREIVEQRLVGELFVRWRQERR